MSEIIARPEALLDGATSPSNLLHPKSDALVYMKEASIFPRLFIELLDDIPHLSNPNMLRLAGSVGSPDIEGRELMTIRGEAKEAEVSSERTKPRFLRRQQPPTLIAEEKVRYGFDIIPDVSTEDDVAEDDASDSLIEVYVGGKLVKSFKEEARVLGMYSNKELIRISRLSGESDENTTLQTLGLVGIQSTGRPVFYEAEALDEPHPISIKGFAKKHELTQMIAAAADAAEWAFD